MGYHADRHVENYASGRWGMPCPGTSFAPISIKKPDIAGERFKIVEVVGSPTTSTNRTLGSKLIVCDCSEKPDRYLIWASKSVTAISKEVCRTLKEDLSINEALTELGRKPYKPYVKE